MPYLDSLEVYLTRHDEKFEFLQEEIMIRIESMKSELDEIPAEHVSAETGIWFST